MAASFILGLRFHRVLAWVQRATLPLVLAGCCWIPEHVEPPMRGHFTGRVAAEWLADGRDMLLLEDYAFTDSANVTWMAITGHRINGASIPQALWTIVGSPYTGKYRNASVVHDQACDDKTAGWKAVHKMFYEACVIGGVDHAKAKLMYAAVYIWGPRWRVGHVNPTEQPTVMEILALREALKRHHPVLQSATDQEFGAFDIQLEQYKAFNALLFAVPWSR